MYFAHRSTYCTAFCKHLRNTFAKFFLCRPNLQSTGRFIFIYCGLKITCTEGMRYLYIDYCIVGINTAASRACIQSINLQNIWRMEEQQHSVGGSNSLLMILKDPIASTPSSTQTNTHTTMITAPIIPPYFDTEWEIRSSALPRSPTQSLRLLWWYDTLHTV